MSYVVRAADWDIPGEKNMIRKSWLRSASRSGMARVVGDKAYWSGQHDLIEQLLGRGDVLVACSETSSATILGWGCASGGVLHYVFVVEDFRRHGIARAILQSLGVSTEPDGRVVYTHRTDAMKEIRLPDGWFYDPYQLMLRKVA